MSWKLEVHACGDYMKPKRFASNALRFATREEAEAYCSELGSRWFGFDDSRTVECDDHVTHTACTAVHNAELPESCVVDGCYYGKVANIEG